MDSIRWGILATGNIAAKLAAAINDVDDAELLAVGSRSQASADAFGDKWGVPRRYNSYTALAADPDVDVIYIATPHSYHDDNMRLCLEAGKHVLCEKPFTLNASEAETCVALAREKGLFLMDAMWMRTIPAIIQVRRWLEDDRIGQPRLLQADFTFDMEFDPDHRLFNPALGGGALLDVGVYPLALASMVMGDPEMISGQAILGQTGVDELDGIILSYPTEALAVLSCGIRAEKPQEATIMGSNGRIVIHPPFHCPDTLTLYSGDNAPETVTIPFSGNGYVHEVVEVNSCLRDGRLESPLMPLDETIRLMRQMDTLRAMWGVRYPGEQSP